LEPIYPCRMQTLYIIQFSSSSISNCDSTQDKQSHVESTTLPFETIRDIFEILIVHGKIKRHPDFVFRGKYPTRRLILLLMLTSRKLNDNCKIVSELESRSHIMAPSLTCLTASQICKGEQQHTHMALVIKKQKLFLLNRDIGAIFSYCYCECAYQLSSRVYLFAQKLSTMPQSQLTPELKTLQPWSISGKYEV
jgi:hypothetical protein